MSGIRVPKRSIASHLSLRRSSSHASGRSLELTQQYLDARRRGKWLLNTSNCFSYQRPCEYLAYCQSGFSQNVADNLYEIALPNEELSRADSEAPRFDFKGRFVHDANATNYQD